LKQDESNNSRGQDRSQGRLKDLDQRQPTLDAAGPKDNTKLRINNLAIPKQTISTSKLEYGLHSGDRIHDQIISPGASQAAGKAFQVLVNNQIVSSSSP
jgi:hypothetical protein